LPPWLIRVDSLIFLDSRFRGNDIHKKSRFEALGYLEMAFKSLTEFDRIKAILGNDEGNEGTKKDGER